MFEWLCERFIRDALEARRQGLQFPIAGQCPVRQVRKHQTLENASIPKCDQIVKTGAPPKPAGRLGPGCA